MLLIDLSPLQLPLNGFAVVVHTTTPWPRPMAAWVASARGGESPRACNEAQREWKAPWSAQTQRGRLGKPLAVVFVDVFGAAGYELAVLGSVVNPCRRCRRDEGTLVASLNSKLTIRSIRLKSDRVGHAARHLGGTIT